MKLNIIVLCVAASMVISDKQEAIASPPKAQVNTKVAAKKLPSAPPIRNQAEKRPSQQAPANMGGFGQGYVMGMAMGGECFRTNEDFQSKLEELAKGAPEDVAAAIIRVDQYLTALE